MGRGADNYFLILELDFMEPESDMGVINKRIDEKARFWNANSERGKKAAKYRQYKAQLIDIKKVMKTETARKAEAKEAKEYVQGILKEQLKFFAGKKEIEKTPAEAIMKASGLWPEMFEKMTGLKVVEDTEGVSAPKPEDPNSKPQFISKFKTSEVHLDTLQKCNLYDFLADSSSTDIIGMQSLGSEELVRSYSNPLKERYKNERTDVGTAVRTLCSLCEEIFDAKKQSMREEYDKFIIWQRKDDVINRMVKYSGAGKMLNEQQAKLFVDELTQIERNREKAVKSFQDICVFKEIRCSSPVSVEASAKNQVACGRCYAMVDVSHGERKCSSCGSDLYVKCPRCQAEIPTSSSACGYCGFKMDNVQKVEQLCLFAKEAIANMDFLKAGNHLAAASRLLSAYEKIAKLKKELEKQECAFSKEMEQLNHLVSKKAYYQAGDILKTLQKKTPSAKIANAVLIESAVAEAERLYKQAVTKTSENELIKMCSQIVSVCADYPGIDALVLKYPPQPVSNVKLEVDTSNCANILTWEKSISEGEIFYKIIRKENTAAASIDDKMAKEVGVAGSPRFVDTDLKAGVDYYYSIYTMRAGVSSKPVFVNGINLAEAVIVGKEEGDGYVRVEWKPLEKNIKAEVWKCKGKVPSGCGDGEKIVSGSNYFIDNMVENGHEYGYLIVLNYQARNKNITTKGISFMLMPASIPEPVDDLTVTNVEDEIFEARWSYEGSERIALYCTDTRCSFQFGDTVDSQKVSESLKLLDVISSAKNSCRFRIKDDKKYSIIPVTVKNNTAVIGEQAIAAKLEKIKIKNTEWQNSELCINIEWPKDAVSILALYGNDQYAKKLDDRKGKTSRNISKKQFDVDGALILKNIEKKDYYITLYSACKVNGRLVYSDGTQLLFSNKPKENIQYSIHVKGFLSKQIEIEFKSAEPSFSIPDIDIISKQNGIPVYADSGSVVEHIDAQTVEGRYMVTLDAKKLPKGSYLKAFFSDDGMNDYISLRPVYGTDFKVN